MKTANTLLTLALAATVGLTGCCKKKACNNASQQQPAPVAETTADDPSVISFTMAGMDGNMVDVKQVFAKSRITIVDFWASWCGPCRNEMPVLVELYSQYHDKGLGILGVSLDEDRQQWADATKQLGITWPQVSDLQGWDNAAAVKYEVKGIPFTVIVDNEGKILKAGLRGDELKAFVAETLAK